MRKLYSEKTTLSLKFAFDMDLIHQQAAENSSLECRIGIVGITLQHTFRSLF